MALPLQLVEKGMKKREAAPPNTLNPCCNGHAPSIALVADAAALALVTDGRRGRDAVQGAARSVAMGDLRRKMNKPKCPHLLKHATLVASCYVRSNGQPTSDGLHPSSFLLLVEVLP